MGFGFGFLVPCVWGLVRLERFRFWSYSVRGVVRVMVKKKPNGEGLINPTLACFSNLWRTLDTLFCGAAVGRKGPAAAPHAAEAAGRAKRRVRSLVVVVVIVAICRAGAGVSGPSGAPSSQLRLQPTQCRFKPSTPGRACRACGEGWVGGMGVRVGGGAPRSTFIAARASSEALASCANGTLRLLPAARADSPAITTWFRRA